MPVSFQSPARMPAFGAQVHRPEYTDTLKLGDQELKTEVEVEQFDDIVLLGGARTPFTTAGTDLRDVSARDLLRIAMQGALDKTGVAPEDVKKVVAGNIIGNQEESPFLPRNTGLKVSPNATAVGLNLLCGTGFEVLSYAANKLTNGAERRVILTGGVENMSQTPVMQPKQMMAQEGLNIVERKGLGIPIPKTGRPNVDAAITTGFNKAVANAGRLYTRHIHPPAYEAPLPKGLTDPEAEIMYGTGDNLADVEGITRRQADAFAASSQVKAAVAQYMGNNSAEVVPVRKNDLTQEGPWKSKVRRDVTADNHNRLKATPGMDSRIAHKQTLGKLAKLQVLDSNKACAIHTAGSSSGVVDGAAAIAVSTGQFAAERNYPVLARLKAVAVATCPPKLMGAGPIAPIRALLATSGLTMDDIDLIEVNEAFAGQALAVAKQLGLTKPKDDGTLEVDSRFNVDGGAIALGHPLAASGSRITLHAARLLQRDEKRFAVVSACIGGGQGIAALIENPNGIRRGSKMDARA